MVPTDELKITSIAPSESSETTLEDKELLQVNEVHIQQNMDNASITVTPITPAKSVNDANFHINLRTVHLAMPDIGEDFQHADWDTMDLVALEYYTIDSKTLDTNHEFVAFHCYLFDLVNKWRTTIQLTTETKIK